MVSWQDRLKTTIQFISPDGNTFVALWRGGPRNIEKKLGIFQIPKVKGAKIQDLDVGASTYPLTIYFEGPDHDVEAERFYKACSERGTWTINHPVKGIKVLQLVTCTENVQPLDFGNITQFTTAWIEPITETVELTPAMLKSSTINQVDSLNSTTADQFESVVETDTFSLVQAIESATDAVTAAVDTALAPLYELNNTINSQIMSIKNGIDAGYAGVLNVLSLAGQVQQLIQLPFLVATDVKAKVNAYSNFVTKILDMSPETATGKDRNTVAVQELALTSYIAASSFIAVTGELSTRAESIELIDSMTDLFNDLTNELDTVQELFNSLSIDNQYFSQSESFGESTKITATALAFLIKNIFDLAIEKRFVLEKRRAPIEITITEYGDLGEDDINLDLFISSNKLKSNDILLLPAGREVVVYV
jgi:prophage DNA circulation protein